MEEKDNTSTWPNRVEGISSREESCTSRALPAIVENRSAALTPPPAPIRTPHPSSKNAFRDLDVHPDVRFVDELRDRDVAGDADELIRLVPRQALRYRQKIDHLLNGF